MRCKNCNGHYRTIEMHCPYCGTENLLGKLWQSERSEAELAYDLELEKTRRIISPYVMNRLFSRIILLEVVFLALYLLGVMLFFFASEGWTRLDYLMHKDEIHAQIQTYYQEEKFNQIDGLIDRYHIDDKTIKVEANAADLYTKYATFLEEKYELFSEVIGSEYRDVDSTVSRVLELGHRIWALDDADIEPENRQFHEVYKEDVYATFRGLFHLDEEEVKDILEIDYLYYKDSEAYAKKVSERNGW